MKKIASIFIALLVLSMGMKPAIAYHFCGGELAQVKIVAGSGSASCGMDADHCQAEPFSGQSIQEEPCCEDVVEHSRIDKYSFMSSPDQKIVSLSQPVSASLGMTLPALSFPSENFQSLSPPGIAAVDLTIICVYIL